MWVPICPLVRMCFLVGSLVPWTTTGILLRENVVFRKINKISPTRSQWSVAMVETFDNYDDIISQLYVQLNRTRLFAAALSKYYFLKRNKEYFKKITDSAQLEIDNVEVVYQRIRNLLHNVR